MSSAANKLALKIKFGGGAELLVNKKKEHNVELDGSDWTLKKLIFWIRDNLLSEREELFVQGDSVRPGILVLVNDADWELLGKGECKLCPNDTVLFISTLHGG